MGYRKFVCAKVWKKEEQTWRCKRCKGLRKHDARYASQLFINCPKYEQRELWNSMVGEFGSPCKD